MNPYLLIGIFLSGYGLGFYSSSVITDAGLMKEAIEQVEAINKQVEIADNVVVKTIVDSKSVEKRLRKIHEKIVYVKINDCKLDVKLVSLLNEAINLSPNTSISTTTNARVESITCRNFTKWAVKQIEKYKQAQVLNKGIIEWDRKINE